MPTDLFVDGELYLADELSICGATTLLNLTDRAMDTCVHVVPTQWWISDKEEITHGGILYSKTGDVDETVVEETHICGDLDGSLG